MDRELRSALDFLRSHLPRDWAADPGLMERFAAHAVRLRREYPRVAALDWEVFCHYVLCPRVNDEDLSFCSEIFYNELAPRVGGLDAVEDTVLEVNRWCHEHVTYRPTDEHTEAPLTVYRLGYGRCGEESAFLVAALRSVGIPARQMYVPRWSHCDDNHAWVEALCGGRWRYLGACEPELELDRGWFPPAAAQAMLARSRVFGAASSPVHGEFLYEEDGVRFYNQTARYAPAGRWTFRAARDGRPVPGAVFSLQILNEAAFHEIARLTADEHGEASALLGYGSLRVLANGDGCRAECQLWGQTGGDLRFDLSLAPPPAEDIPWTDFDFHPPEAPPAVSALSPEDRERRAEILRRGDALRAAWVASQPQPEPIPAPPTAVPVPDGPRGALRLTFDGPSPIYRRDWSLALQTDRGWQTRDLAAIPWKSGVWEAVLTPGRYRIITTVRLPAGDQLTALRELTMRPGAAVECALYFRSCRLEELLYRRTLPPVPAVTEAGAAVPDVFAPGGSPALTLWLEPGQEPTEHLLNELAERGGFPAAVTALVRERGELDHPQIAALRRSGARVLLGGRDDIEPVTRRLNCDPSLLPLAVLTDGAGLARFAAAGYRVGTADLLARLAERMERQREGAQA